MTRLGKFLHNHSAAEIRRKTNISQARLSLLTNDYTTKIYAEEFYLISLAIKADIDLMANEVFQDFKLQLLNLPDPSNNKSSKELTRFGQLLKSKLNNPATLSRLTGIKKSRISSLSNKQNSGLLGYELFLISLALNISPKNAWETLYEGIHLKSPEEEIELKQIEAANRKKTNNKKPL